MREFTSRLCVIVMVVCVVPLGKAGVMQIQEQKVQQAVRVLIDLYPEFFMWLLCD